MVCALGAISAPYSECFPNSPKSSPIYPNLHIGKLFFTAAKKRFGTAIVRNKLTTVQCLFLAGIYCMYTMQQFSAWKMFNSASVACQAYLMKRKTWRGLPSSAGPVVNVGKGRRKKRRMADIEDRDGVISEETQNFEKRIYWSCLKSEVEICVELETCTSGLSELRYPHAFPSPPRHSRSPPAVEAPATNSTNSGTTGEGVYPLSSVLNATSSPTNNTSIQSPLSNSTNTPHTPATTVATSSSRTNYYTGSTTANPQEDEITWFYYLAEIALRKIERKISEALHPDPVTGPRARKNLPTSDDEDEDFNEDDPNNTTRSSPEYSRRRAHSNRHAVRNKYSLRPPPPPPPRCPAPAEMEELLNLTTEFEIQLGIWYSYLPSTVKFADLDPTPCRDERLQYLRGRSWKTKSDLYRPFLYHLIHQPHSNYIRNNYAPGTYERVAEFARKGLIYDKLFIMATVIEHRHHGAWLTLRNSGAGALVYLAAKKCGWFVKEGEANGGDGLVEIPEGCEEALEKTKKTLRFWGEKRGARDAIPLVEMICKVEEDWFGGGNGNGMKGEMGMGVMGVTTMGMEQGRW
ncbi:hypothetical protein BDZ91DRAFT_517867 [Kalaharituber pfeilii]|nr:hypothetical protein BDZ91DRAFT_517867 [Kalaharituber pfeilii]